MLLKVQIDRSQPQYFISTEVDIYKYSFATSVLGDLYGPPAVTHAKWDKNSDFSTFLNLKEYPYLNIPGTDMHQGDTQFNPHLRVTEV